jgi:hypothetical protein
MNPYQVVTVRDEAGTILDPLERAASADAGAARATAPRPASLHGQTLAVIDNRAGGAFRVRLVDRLRSMFDFEDVIVVLKDTVNVPPRPEDWEEVTRRGTVGLALYGA